MEFIKSRNETIHGENISSGKGILQRIKIKDFRPGINFDFKLQIPSLREVRRKNIHFFFFFFLKHGDIHFKKNFEILKKFQNIHIEEEKRFSLFFFKIRPIFKSIKLLRTFLQNFNFKSILLFIKYLIISKCRKKNCH